MRSTGNVRRVDELGRVVIPAGLRKQLSIDLKDPIEIYVEGEQIVLKKHIPSCFFCESTQDVITFEGKNLCKECVLSLSR